MPSIAQNRASTDKSPRFRSKAAPGAAGLAKTTPYLNCSFCFILVKQTKEALCSASHSHTPCTTGRPGRLVSSPLSSLRPPHRTSPCAAAANAAPTGRPSTEAAAAGAAGPCSPCWPWRPPRRSRSWRARPAGSRTRGTGGCTSAPSGTPRAAGSWRPPSSAAAWRRCAPARARSGWSWRTPTRPAGSRWGSRSTRPGAACSWCTAIAHRASDTPRSPPTTSDRGAASSSHASTCQVGLLAARLASLFAYYRVPALFVFFVCLAKGRHHLKQYVGFDHTCSRFVLECFISWMALTSMTVPAIRSSVQGRTTVRCKSSTCSCWTSRT
jgi:hypothetical protein